MMTRTLICLGWISLPNDFHAAPWNKPMLNRILAAPGRPGVSPLPYLLPIKDQHLSSSWGASFSSSTGSSGRLNCQGPGSAPQPISTRDAVDGSAAGQGAAEWRKIDLEAEPATVSTPRNTPRKQEGSHGRLSLDLKIGAGWSSISLFFFTDCMHVERER